MRHSRGNILFLILLAVVLFAALSYAVTSSMRGGGKDASGENLKTQIATIQNFGMQMRSAVMRMTMTGGYNLWQIDFSAPDVSASTANATCATAACKFHDPAGGGVTPALLPARFRADNSVCNISSVFGGKYWIRNATVKGVGIDTQRDLVLLYPGVTKALCLAVNEANGVANPSGNPPEDSTMSSADYSGTLTQDVALTDTVQLGAAAPINGQQMFCVRETNFSSTNCYYLYFVLMER